MASVTCGLTADDRDKLQNHTLVLGIGMGLPLSYSRTTWEIWNQNVNLFWIFPQQEMAEVAVGTTGLLRCAKLE